MPMESDYNLRCIREGESIRVGQVSIGPWGGPMSQIGKDASKFEPRFLKHTLS